MSATSTPLPSGITVFERGWLSSNNILLIDDDHVTLVDTGYCTHADQTLALVAHALAREGMTGRTLDRIVNTHLHSDHCGGNAALKARYPNLQTFIPAGMAEAVTLWDESRLGYQATGQSIDRYGFDCTLRHSDVLKTGKRLIFSDAHGSHSPAWQVHAAPGHDAHAVMLFEPNSRTLISADALWATGFGVVFPELDGEHAFDDVAATLDLIERLAPTVVIPGHGPVFTDVAAALQVARHRLEGFVRSPQRHLKHAAKVLVKYKLLEWGAVDRSDLVAWALATPLLVSLHRQNESASPEMVIWLDDLLADLARSGAARLEGQQVWNA